jgi:hypothetical protein
MIELLFAEAPGSMVPQGTEPGARIEAMNEM